MGVMMGKMVEVNGKEVQLILQGLDEEDLIKQVNAINEMERKANAFDEIKKYVDEEVDSYMTLYRETKDPVYSLLNSHYDTLLGYIEELERADDDH